MIDTNVSVGLWPFRKLPIDSAAALVDRLRRANIEQAWVGSLDGLFQRDVAGVNIRLAADCKTADPVRLKPFGTVNPTLPDWEDDLRRCHETHRFRGIRLHPNFHGYKLADPAFARLLALAAGRGLLVQIVAGIEDERTQYPVFQVPAVDFRPLESLAGNIANLRLVILNAFRTLTIEASQRLAAAGKVYFDIATLEGVDGLATLVERIGADRIVFGSHFPLFHIESAALKLRETKQPPVVVTQIAHNNAQQLLGF
jgi:predicted TIM-barrel fold metal-dependent hydrolase